MGFMSNRDYFQVQVSVDQLTWEDAGDPCESRADADLFVTRVAILRPSWTIRVITKRLA